MGIWNCRVNPSARRFCIRHRPERTSKSLVASFFAIPRANTWPSPSPLLGSQVQQSRKVYQRRQTGNASTPHQLASFEHRHLHVPDVLDSNVAFSKDPSLFRQYTSGASSGPLDTTT
ncbi:hypothetical protein ACJBU6_10359 [Exserohilum turcicum]